MKIGNLSLEKKIILAVAIFVLLSFGGCLVMSLGELASFRPQKISVAPPKKKVAKKEEKIRPAIYPLELLPRGIGGYITNARQKVPGHKELKAEAIFQPEDEDLMRPPLHSYVRISFHPSSAAAREEIKETAKRFSVDSKELNIGANTAISGFQADYGSHYIGWSSDGYSIEITTSFASKIAIELKDRLADIGGEVALAVDAAASVALRK